MPKSKHEKWTFVFEALPDTVPAPIRVRQLLKGALRTLRLRCVHCVVDSAVPIVTSGDQSNNAKQ